MYEIKHLFFTLHTNCNFSCSYCWQRHRNVLTAKLDYKKVLDIIDYFYETYFLFYPKNTEIKITFSGGEGLLYREELFQYLERIKEYEKLNIVKTEIHIQTNGFLLTEEFLQQLSNYNIVLQISYDGLGQNITRQAKEKIYQNIQLATTYLPVNITSIYTPETIKYLTGSFLEIQNLSIQQWSIGLDFLRSKEEYNLIELTKQIDFINKNNNKLNIKNFHQLKSSYFTKSEFIKSIQGINISPYGEYMPINYVYTKNTNPLFFGNDSEGLDEKKFENYVEKKLKKLNKNKYADNEYVCTDIVVKNLLNF